MMSSEHANFIIPWSWWVEKDIQVLTQQLDGILTIQVRIVIKETGSLEYLVIHSIYR